MKLLFKLNSTVDDPQNPTVGETDFKEHYPAVHKSMVWKSLEPYVRQVTKNYLLKYVDKATYTALVDAYHGAGVTEGSDEAELLEKMQDAIAYYTMWEAMLHKNVVIGDKGVQQTNSQNNSSVPASQWAYKSTRWELVRRADDLLDEVLLFMEEKKNENFLSTWKDSKEYKNAKASFFHNATELQQYVDIRKSFRTFLALIPFLEKAVKKYILPILCQEQLDDLKEKHLSGQLSAPEEQLLSRTQAVVAEFGALMALPHLSIVMEHSGFKIISQNDGMTQRTNMANQQHMESVQQLKYQLDEDGKTFRADLINYVHENIDDFPLIKDSSCYYEPDEDDDGIYANHVGGIML